MNRNKLHRLRQRTAADSLIGELLDALLDDGPMFGAAELADKFKAAEPVQAGKPPESFRGVLLGPYWAPAEADAVQPGAVIVDGARLAQCRQEIAQARELLQAIAERFE